MRIIYISRYRKKAVSMLAIIMFWVCMFFIADFIINNNLPFSISIDNYLKFSYPYGIVADNILVSKSAAEKNVQTGSSFSKPVMEEFLSYKSLEGRFSFDYPAAFVIRPQNFTGSDILYHIDFHNQENTAHGFVQVWNMPYPLKQFLDSSKAASQQKYRYFNVKKINVGNMPGYLWDYAALGNNGVYYKGNEVFVQKDQRMYRISYFMPESDWNAQQAALFMNMVKSLKVY